MESNHRPLKYQFSTLPLSYVPKLSGWEELHFPLPASKAGFSLREYTPYFIFFAESRIFEIHPFYRTTRLAGGDNTLIVLLSIFVSPGGFEPHILKSVAWCSIRWTMETICSQDRSRTCTIEKTNFIRFFGMVNIFNVMSHGPINQSPITRLPFRHLTNLRVRNLWQTTNFYFHWVFRLYFQVLCSLYLWENCPFL